MTVGNKRNYNLKSSAQVKRQNFKLFKYLSCKIHKLKI